MNLLDKIANLSAGRVKKVGASYYAFSLFTIINHPLAYLYEINSGFLKTDFFIRMFPVLLSLIILFHKKWPENLKKYLPLLWHITVMFSIPVLGGFMLLANNFSPAWLLNSTVVITLLLFLLDVATFMVIELIGQAIGILIYFASGYSLQVMPDHGLYSIFIYGALHIIIFGIIFSKNREQYSDYLQKAKDELNKVLEDKVALRTAQLQKALDTRTEFLNNISHEIRTPVQGIGGIAHGVVSNWNEITDSDRLEYVKVITKNSDRLLSLVGSILDFSKYQDGNIKLDMRVINLNQVIEEMIDECWTLYVKNPYLEIIYNPPKNVTDSKIEGDKEAISQVLRNIMTNAIKFSKQDQKTFIKIFLEEGSRELEHTHSSEQMPTYNIIKTLELSIEDEGPGIPEDQVELIFDAFAQSSRTKTKAGGVGLGLAITKKLVLAHGGDIWAENKKTSTGTIFKLWLPQINNSQENRFMKKEQEDLKNAKILMVDDEEACLLSMELILKNSNFDLVQANGGTNGLDYLNGIMEEDKPSLILLDLMMPDIYGIEFIEKIKSSSKTSDIPVILQSGSSDYSQIDKAFELGIDGYIRKPYNKESILSEIYKVLDNTKSI